MHAHPRNPKHILDHVTPQRQATVRASRQRWAVLVRGACAALLMAACGAQRSPAMTPGYAGAARASSDASYTTEEVAVAGMPTAARQFESLTAEAVPTSSAGSAPTAQAAQPTAPAPAPGPGSGTQAVAQGAQNPQAAKEALVIEAWLVAEVEDVAGTAAAIRQQVESGGGRVAQEQVEGGGGRAWNGHLVIKVPPGEVPGFMQWLEKNTTIINKRVQGTDVSRQLFDYAIALQNQEHTLSRLHALLDRQGLSMQEILTIENEMTRLRGQIESIKGEKRFLEHRVAFATITLDLRQPEDQIVILGDKAKAKLYPGPRMSSLILLDPDGRERVRLGGGVELRLAPQVPITLDVFQDADDTGAGVLATIGGVMYSDFLGRGHRRFLNPHLDLHLGYSYLDASAFAFGAGAGVELFKHQYVLVDVGARVFGLAGESFDTALLVGGAVVFAF